MSETALNSKRNSGIDLLRIVAMGAIMMLHVIGQGGILQNVSQGDANYYVAWFLEILCYFSVTAYALISGYVGIEGKIRFSNLIYLWLQVFFYMCIATVCFAVFVPGSVGKTQILGLVFPVMTEQYWYFSAYFGMFIFTPLIKAAFENLNKGMINAILGLLLVVTCIMPVFFSTDIYGIRGGSSFLWLLVAYFAGAYIRKYDPFKKLGNISLLIIFILAVLATFALKIIADGMDISDRFIAYNSVTLLPASISMVELFRRFKTGEKAGKVISLVAPLTFGVYLSNCQPLVWSYLMKDRFVQLSGQPFGIMALRVLLSALTILLVGIAIDGIRKLIFDVLGIRIILRRLLKEEA